MYKRLSVRRAPTGWSLRLWRSQSTFWLLPDGRQKAVTHLWLGPIVIVW